MEKIVRTLCLVGLVALTMFLAGYGYRHLNLWPSRDIAILSNQVRLYQKFGYWGRPRLFMNAPPGQAGLGAQVIDQQKLLPGYRAIMGYDGDLQSYSVRLFNSAGDMVHVWKVSRRSISPNTSGNWEANPHGLVVLPDASIVVNFGVGGDLLARLDRCSEPLWIQNGIYHHSLDIDDDGHIWTWYSPDHIDGQIQSMRQINVENGETLREITLEDVAAVGPENALVLGIPDDFKFERNGFLSPFEELDVFHPNDVEALPAAIAADFPGFEAGDLLISLRNLNLVAVLDPDTLSFKWYRKGPWIQQHDPDFLPGGTISIYDNATGRGRTDIVTVDPVSGAAWRHLPTNSPRFYSSAQGKHQRLQNGASLITVPDEGRVLELSEDGSEIFVYNNSMDAAVNARVLNAIWVPDDYFRNTPECKSG